MREGGVIELTEAIKPKARPKKIRARKEFKEWKERQLGVAANKEKGIDGKSDNMS
jgi:hypothetical protein